MQFELRRAAAFVSSPIHLYEKMHVATLRVVILSATTPLIAVVIDTSLYSNAIEAYLTRQLLLYLVAERLLTHDFPRRSFCVFVRRFPSNSISCHTFSIVRNFYRASAY